MTQARQPSLGETYHPFEDEQRENPYPFYKRAREQESVVYSPELEAWLVTRYNDIRSMLSHPAIFSSRDVTRPVTNLTPETREILQQGYPMVPNAISSDGFSHKRFREPYVHAYSPARSATYEQHIRETAEHLLDEIVDAGTADVIGQFAYPLTMDTILYTMGIPLERMEDAKRWSRDLTVFLYSPLSPERQAECARSMVAFQHYMAELIEERRRERQADAISEMVHSQIAEAEPLSMNELVSALCGLVMAGHKTSIDLVGNGLVALLSTPPRWQELCAHPDLIPQTIEEILRYDSPVQALSRTTTCETTIGDVTLPAGARVLAVFGSANRDAEQFAAPEDFDMHRDPNRHLAFGYGIHFCVGAPLARLEGCIAFEVLTRRFPQLRLVPDQQLVHNPILAFRGYRQLLIEW